MNICIGHKDKIKREELIQRKLNYDVVRGWATGDSLPPIHVWWPIDGEILVKVKLPTQKQLKKHDDIFRSLGKKK